MTVYAIASGKGGVGKTTTAVNVGTALARAGERVAVVDVDLGMANLAGLVGLDGEPTTLHDVLAGEASVPEATYERRERLHVVPSGADLQGFAETSSEDLREAVADLREEYPHVLLDVGAGVSYETVLPLGLADEVVVVSTPDPMAVRDAEKTLELTETAGGSVVGLVVTRTQPSTDEAVEEIVDRLDVPLLGTVPEDPAVRESALAGTPLVAFDEESPAAVACARIAAELAGVEPLESAAGEDAPDEPSDATDEETDAVPVETGPAGTATSGAPRDEDDADDDAADDYAADDDATDDVSDSITEAESDP